MTDILISMKTKPFSVSIEKGSVLMRKYLFLHLTGKHCGMQNHI